MPRRCATILMLTGWLLATGSHWDLVQTFAWGRMIATYAQSMPLPEAIRLTFTPEAMCGVCEVVADAKAGDPAAPVPTTKQELKIQLGLVHGDEWRLVPAPSLGWGSGHANVPAAMRAPPPVPPPRTV